MAQRLGGYPETPFLVVVGVPDKAALEATILRLQRYGIDHEAFHEPDHDMGLSAVATTPITNKKHRKAMFVYKLWAEPRYESLSREEQTFNLKGHLAL